MKRIARERPRTPSEVAEIEAVRELVAADLPELIATYYAQAKSRRAIRDLLRQLQDARRAKGLGLDDLPDLTAEERSILADHEAGRPTTVRLKTLRHYARAVGKRVVVSLADA